MAEQLSAHEMVRKLKERRELVLAEVIDRMLAAAETRIPR